MSEEISPVKDPGIEELLQDNSPSELDARVPRLCPHFEDDEREFTSAYGAIHRFAQARLFTRLQLELEDLRVRGETESGEGGRVDGLISEYRVALDGRKVELRSTEGGGSSEVAVLEVKTGEVGPLQPAAYAHRWELPAIVAELKTGDVHLVDRGTARELLSEAVEHVKDQEELRGSGIKIPDLYECRDCGNRDCEHYTDGDYQAGNGVIEEKSKVLRNVGTAVEKIVSTICEILEGDGYSSVPGEQDEAGRGPSDEP